MQLIRHIAVLVRDYDEAIGFYVGKLGFRLTEDTPLNGSKRWVLVSPPGTEGTGLLLAKAEGPQQKAAIGWQGGGRVLLFLQTDDFRRDHQQMLGNGIKFLERPREEVYGTVAVFEDLYGNKWDLIEPKSGA